MYMRMCTHLSDAYGQYVHLSNMWHVTKPEINITMISRKIFLSYLMISTQYFIKPDCIQASDLRLGLNTYTEERKTINLQ